MTDDLFSQLFELFNQPGPVNWKLAEQVARHLSGTREPIDPWLADEYQDLTRVAQMHLASVAALRVGSEPSGTPVDRATWAELNLRSFRYLVEPLAAKMGEAEALPSPAAGPFEAVFRSLGPALLGMQMGTMVGLLSHRVLGQFDVGLPAEDTGRLFYVVPNIEAFARDNHLDPRQVRLWVALHEVTHQAEFAIPWVGPTFRSLVDEFLAGLEFDAASIGEKLQALQDPSSLEQLMDDPAGIAGLVMTDAQRPALEAIQAFMAVMEGYADHLMDRAAPQLLPDVGSMREAMSRRRAEASESDLVLSRFMGLELKRLQYEQGAAFCADIERRWGSDTLNTLWQGPDKLPTLAELTDPVGWAARVLVADDLL